MEHEDNTQFDNYLQNSMESVQIASGGGGEDGGRLVTGEEIGMVGGIGNTIGGKFEEHEVPDDVEEWKYIKEVHQSEKQQAMKVDGIEAIGVGNGNESVGELLVQHEVGNGDVNVAVTGSAVNVDEEDVEIIKNDGDFSTTSNTTSTAGEDVGTDILQVEMNIEAAQPLHLNPHEEQQQQQQQQEQEQEQLQLQQQQQLNMPPQFGELVLGRGEETEEEEPSSLATNGTSSLSENPPQQFPNAEDNQLHQEDYGFGHDDLIDKENFDPISGEKASSRPSALDIEMHSQLNPDAQEFVPTFGSNPTSPTTGAAVTLLYEATENVGEPDLHAGEPHPAPLARHLLDAEDDFLAQSPQKGRGYNMDAISLPGENEFEHEAATRPHELEQEDDLIGDGVINKQPVSFEPYETLENGNCSNDFMNIDAAGDGGVDLQRHSPASLIDHGPETCVDLDAETDLHNVGLSNGVPVSHEPPIEQLLNTVQPLPTDTESLNTSFSESNVEPEIASKELLQVEEKEHVSHSPSIEEVQMNLQNELHAPLQDMDAIDMQESFYMEHTSVDANQPANLLNTALIGDDSLLTNTSNPLVSSYSDISFEPSQISTALPTASFDALHPLDPFPESSAIVDTTTTPSPLSTVEKHLVEETKESSSLLLGAHIGENNLSELERKMSDLALGGGDGTPKQEEEVDHTATTNAENLFLPQADPFVQHFVEPIKPEQEQVLTSLQIEQPILQDEEQHGQQIQQQQLPQYELFPQQLPADPFAAAIHAESEPLFEASPAAAVTTKSQEEVWGSAPPVAEVAEGDLLAVAAVAGTAAVAAAATAAVVASADAKKADGAKKPSAAPAGKAAVGAKPKAGDVKKALDAKKSTTSTVSSRTSTSTTAARPRSAPAKSPAAGAATGAAASKKTSTGTTAAAKPATSATKKPSTASSATAAGKVSPRASTAASTAKLAPTSGSAAKPSVSPRSTAPRAATSTNTTATRRSLSAATTNGSAAKPRPATAPTKPTTLGLSAKPKQALTSPRATLTSQLRKTSGPTGSAKSPTGSATTASNGVATKTSTTTATTSRSRTSGSNTTTTHTTTTTTKTFTARPAPKSTRTITATSTTTRRVPTTGVSTGNSLAVKTTSTGERKLSPGKTGSVSSGKISPNKTSAAAALKSKTKETKPEALKKSPKTSNGAVPVPVAVPGKEETAIEPKQTLQLNGDVVPELLKQENGTFEHGQNGDHVGGHDTPLGVAEQMALIDA